MKKIFAPDSGLMLSVSLIFDVLIVSLLFLVCSIPVVTIGTAMCALYNTTGKVIIHREGYVVRDFLQNFARNLKKGLVAWTIFLIVFIIMSVNIFYVLNTMSGGVAVAMLAIYFAILFCAIVLAGYVFTVLARFECTMGQLFGSTLRMALDHLKQTILLAILMVAFYLSMGYAFVVFPILLFVIPAGFAWLQRCILEKVLMEYVDGEEDELKKENG